jgi:hypothetical protein
MTVCSFLQSVLKVELLLQIIMIVKQNPAIRSLPKDEVQLGVL